MSSDIIDIWVGAQPGIANLLIGQEADGTNRADEDIGDPRRTNRADEDIGVPRRADPAMRT